MKHLIYLTIIFIFLPATVDAGVLLQKSDLTYLGAFRVPNGNLGGDSVLNPSMGRGGRGLTYNAVNDSLITMGSSQAPDGYLSVEISIPEIVNSTSISALKTATVIQAPGDIEHGNWSRLNLDGSVVGNYGYPSGLLAYNGRIIGSAYPFYAEGDVGHLSHFAETLNWTTEPSEFTGMQRVGTNPVTPTNSNAGFTGGFMGLVPPEWQTRLNYPALAGNGGTSVISRSSYGPSVSGFDPDDIGKPAYENPAITPATMFFGYPSNHQTLGSYSKGNLLFNMVTKPTGVAFPSGSDSILVFGKHGLGFDGDGVGCYGIGTWDINLHLTTYDTSSGELYCYDRVNFSHGTHAYPYVFQVWAYDANDALAVKEGHIVTEQDVIDGRFLTGVAPNNTILAEGQTVKYWNIVPYAIWNFTLPFTDELSTDTGKKEIGGVAYDPTTQRIFISQPLADHWASQYEIPPIIHVFHVNLNPVSDTTAPGSPSGLSVL